MISYLLKSIYLGCIDKRGHHLAVILLTVLAGIFLPGCAVVKTPYFKTDYYRKTITELDKAKSGINHVTDSLFAGFSKRNLVPDASVLTAKYNEKHEIPIAGYGQLKTKYATGIHDSTFVRAIALKAGSEINIIVSGEMLIMPPDVVDSVVSRLKVKGFTRDQLFFTATHTHSGVGGWGYGPLAKIMAGKRNRNIESWLSAQISNAVIDAVNDLKTSRVAAGSFDAPGYTVNRLTGDQYHNNTIFDYILIEQISGKKAIIGSYSAHATTLSRKNTLISGDYPGYWSRKIEDSGIDLAMFCGGSMAGQSPYGPGKEFGSSAFIGESLADSVLVGLEKIRPGNVASVASISLATSLPPYHFRMTANRNFTTCFSKRLMALPQNVFIQALSINNLIWFFTPGDFSGESALFMRRLLAANEYKSLVTGYNGSYVGYIIPGKYFYLDHYEPRSMGWFGPTMGDYIFDLMDQIGKILTSR